MIDSFRYQNATCLDFRRGTVPNLTDVPSKGSKVAIRSLPVVYSVHDVRAVGRKLAEAAHKYRILVVNGLEVVQRGGGTGGRCAAGGLGRGIKAKGMSR